MTQIEMFPTATSSQRDTRASPFHLPGSAEAQKMTDISGHTYFLLFKPNDPLGAFSRMFMGTSLWASTKCYLTWKGKATPQGRSLFQLVPQTHLTDETEFGSSDEIWPTPTARDYKGARKPETLKAVGRDAKNSLPDAVRSGLWPTPTASDNRDRGHKGMPAIKRRMEKGKQLNLSMVVSETSGSLNPQWVEWLMGYPEGWTDLKD